MKEKSLPYLIFLFLITGFVASAQNNYEREHRIRKVQFPKNATTFIDQEISDAKRFRFYKEIDSSILHYKAKFKKDRLWYGIAFDKAGVVKELEIVIKPADIPEESIAIMNSYFASNFKQYKIRKIHQKYPVAEMNTIEEAVKNAFQNLMLPEINYELLITGKKDKKLVKYEVLFDFEGHFKSIQKSLPPNHDHVLY